MDKLPLLYTLSRNLLILILFCVSFPTLAYPIININEEIALRIGVKIWYNECNGRIKGLTSWNDGEHFASLGIGHFNWYPNGHNSTQDGFPQLIKYMEKRGLTVPSWLQGDPVPACPWKTRQEFLNAKDTAKMKELRQFLMDTVPYQAQFMVHRLVIALPKLVQRTDSDYQTFVFEQFNHMLQSQRGIYALVDYVNFKGEGMGKYAPHKSGWGLLQVVEGMREAPNYMDPMQAFVWSADRALTKRVANSPVHSHEHRWLSGWRKRIYSYLD